MSRVSYLVIYEGDRAASNVAAYVPILNLEIIGDTYEEARYLVQENMNQEITSLAASGLLIPEDNAKTETIVMAGGKFPILYETNGSMSHHKAYIPGFRIQVQGLSFEDVQRKVRILLQEEINTRRESNNPVPQDFVQIDRVTIAQRVIHPSVQSKTLQIS